MILAGREIILMLRSLCICVFLGGGGQTHSLTWHRHGDRIPGSRLTARVWMPVDPRMHPRGGISAIETIYNSTGHHHGSL